MTAPIFMAIAQIKKLHSAVNVCRGCCCVHCPGDCDWSDEYGGELLTVCSVCCIDNGCSRQNYECLDNHSHGSEHEAPTAPCSTMEIIARYSL